MENKEEQLKLAGEQIDELFKMNEDLIKKLATNKHLSSFIANMR